MSSLTKRNKIWGCAHEALRNTAVNETPGIEDGGIVVKFFVKVSRSRRRRDEDTRRDGDTCREGDRLHRLAPDGGYDENQRSALLQPLSCYLLAFVPFNRWDSLRKLSIFLNFPTAVLLPRSPFSSLSTASTSSRNGMAKEGSAAR